MPTLELESKLVSRCQKSVSRCQQNWIWTTVKAGRKKWAEQWSHLEKNHTNNRELWKNSNSGLNHCYIIMDYSFWHIIHALPVFYQLTKCDAYLKKLQVLWTVYFFLFKGPNNEDKFYSCKILCGNFFFMTIVLIRSSTVVLCHISADSTFLLILLQHS